MSETTTTPPAAPPATPPPAAPPATSSWRDTLPEDLRSNPSILTVPDVNTLAKNYVNAEKMIGAKRLVIPGERAAPAEWDSFFNAIGRPETVDKYESPSVKPAEGLPMDQAAVDEFRKTAHSAGLTNSQFKKVMDFYVERSNKVHEQVMGQLKGGVATATETLKRDWGDKFDANLDIAKAALRNFGGEDTYKELENGLGNHIGLIKMLHSIGTKMMEDRSRGSSGLMVTGQTQAVQEIEALKLDQDFQKSLNNPQDPGHRAAVDRWMSTFRTAYPGQSD